MEFVKAPDFMKEKVIAGLEKNRQELEKFRVKYTKFGNNIEVLKLIKEAEKLIILERDYQK